MAGEQRERKEEQRLEPSTGIFGLLDFQGLDFLLRNGWFINTINIPLDS